MPTVKKDPSKPRKPRVKLPKGRPVAKPDIPRPDWVVPWEDSTASEVFERFAAKNKYDRGDSELSITQLIAPPRIVALEKIHAEAVKREESTSILSILGSAVHKILEDGAPANFVTERRLFTVIDGVKISGQMDVIVKDYGDGTVAVEDYKVTSMWSISDGPPSSWVKQLNGYAALIRAVHGAKVSKLRVHAVLRDYSKARAPSWMDRPVVTLDIPMWSDTGQDALLLESVRRHKQAQQDALNGDELPECTPLDCWDSAASIDHLQQTGEYIMDHPKRCDAYCSVAQFCSQYQAYQVGFDLRSATFKAQAAKSEGQAGDSAPTG